ncbi:MAG: YmdB family metallophosphoesterase [Ruminococcaceae bacterium]|nr:YmdB family metallophosphoesterase [Oscillospiraceae bacterium]
MLLNLLAVGDVVGDAGLDFLARNLRKLKQEHDVHFTVVNGENAATVGILPHQVQDIYDAGADVVTLGNHTWNKMQIKDRLEDDPYLLRPANFAPNLPGRGFGVYDGPRGLRIGVLSLMGRLHLNSNLDSPFTVADQLLSACDADIVVCDFHGEITSEKGAMAWYLDGRLQALWGTHTHVPTADTQILPKGLGFVTDLGMTGPAQSVLGVRPEDSINLFLGGIPRRFQPAAGPCKLNACLFVIDTNTKKCVQVRRVDLNP